MGKIVTIVNRKGGVGKTPTVVGLADTFVSEYRASVIVVDLDPQASASIAFLGPDAVLELEKVRQNLTGLLEARLHRRNTPAPAYFKGMVNRIVGCADIPLALLPNSETLWDLEGTASQNGMRPELSEILCELLREFAEKYDYVLVDCPPGQSITSEAALRVADLILCPTVADRLSYWGLDALTRYVHNATNGIPHTPKIYFIVTRYQQKLREHRDILEKLLARTTGEIGLLPSASEPSRNGAPRALGAIIAENATFVKRLGDRRPATHNRLYGSKGASELIGVTRSINRELGNA
jgi:chromosome partitioning protein